MRLRMPGLSYGNCAPLLMESLKTGLKRNKYVAKIFARIKTVYFHMRHAPQGASQSNESEILDLLIQTHVNIPKTFVEFGFSGWELNCVGLCNSKEWVGLLIDADPYNCWIAQTRFSKLIDTKIAWITKDNIKVLVKSWLEGRSLGVLSIDVDGNDYWLLNELSDINPSIVVMEYNSAFGIRCISAIYDENFDRREKHKRWTYFGASLTMISEFLCEQGYSLVAISASGVNAFFLRNDLLSSDDKVLDPVHSFKDSFKIKGTSSSQAEWEYIKLLSYARRQHDS